MSRTRSKTCAQAICDKIIADSEFPTFWTLTSADGCGAKELGKRFNIFLVYLKRATAIRQRVYNTKTKRWRVRILKESDIHGFRVVEAGDLKGRLHVHFILNQFLDVTLVRSIAQKAGFGRIYVDSVDKSHVFEYLTKYLCKQQREPRLKGIRLWSEFAGKGARRTGFHAKDVQINSSFHLLWNDSEVQDEINVTDEQVAEPYARHCRKVELHNQIIQKLFADDAKSNSTHFARKVTGDHVQLQLVANQLKLKKPKSFLQFKSFMKLMNFKNLVWERYCKPSMRTESRMLQRLRNRTYFEGFCSHPWICDLDELDY